MSDAISARAPYPSAWRLLGIWAGIGLQSFGGGASTTLLIQRTFIEKYRWVTDEEFTRLWGICLLAPGINLVAVTALLGKKVGGWRGVIASLAGLLLPSGVITCLLAALFTQVEQSHTAQAVLRGVVPATGGVMALVAVNFARPLLRGARLGWRLGLTIALTLAGAGAVIALNVSAIALVIAAALLGALVFARRATPGPARESRASGEPEERAK